MTEFVAVGEYPDWDLAGIAEMGGRVAAGLEELSSLDERMRQGVRVLGYKGHAALDGEVMDLFPALGLIANFGVGYDAIDMAAARSRGIRVTNTPDVLNDDVADLAVAMLLAQSRQIVQGSDWVRSGRWSQEALPLNRKVSGRRVGIAGLGRIGREIADRLAAFKIEIHYHSRQPKDVPADWIYHPDPVALAAAVDDLIVAVVGGADTVGYVSAAAIVALGPDGVIVNISRGSTIDEAALLDALEARRIRAAALDVFLNEPDLDPRFLSLDNVLLQPHQGSGTIETRKAMGALQRDNARAFLAGRDLLTPVG